jgi:hypothetical protein
MDHHAIMAERTTQRPSRGASGLGSIAVCLAILIAVQPSPRARAGDDPRAAPLDSDPAATKTVHAAAIHQNQGVATMTVLTPDSLPAGRAQVAVAAGGSQIWVKNGEVQWSDKAARCETDDHGRFHFAAPSDDFAIVITHPSGYLRLRCSPSSIRQTFKLAPWARVEGTLRVAGKLLPDAPVDVSVDNFDQHGQRSPQFLFSNTTMTDQNANFVFERVVPGGGTVSASLLQNSSRDRVAATSKSVLARFVPGKTTRINLGQCGRPVIGQLQPPPGPPGPFDRLVALVEPTEPRDDVRQVVVIVDGDGNFCLDDVPVGKYRFGVLTVQGNNVRCLFLRQITVPAINENVSQRPVDLGVLTLTTPLAARRRRAAPTPARR